MKLPTIRVKDGDGFVTINEADFDPRCHQRVEAAPVAPTGDSAVPQPIALPAVPAPLGNRAARRAAEKGGAS